MFDTCTHTIRDSKESLESVIESYLDAGWKPVQVLWEEFTGDFRCILFRRLQVKIGPNDAPQAFVPLKVHDNFCENCGVSRKYHGYSIPFGCPRANDVF
jgi:hypothetical protein